MARRSSARIRSRNSTPKRVSLSHDQLRAPRTVPAKLSALDENDEMPGTFPQSPDTSTPTAKRPRQCQDDPTATPKDTTPIQPSDAEMHPQKNHATTAKPLEEARHLGFTHMRAPHTEPAKSRQPMSRIATLATTPSRTAHTQAANPAEDVASPTYQFTFRREHSLELSPEAKRLMLEKREEAQRIREQMVASGDNGKKTSEMPIGGRKLAKPKGRFSEVHGREFELMDSIAGHASSFRVKEKEGGVVVAAAEKCLKRSPSKAQLDDGEPTEKKTLLRSPSKPSVLGVAKSNATTASALEQPSSPTKRLKRAEGDNVSSARPVSRDVDTPFTPQPSSKKLQSHVSYPNLSGLTTPTQSSLARAASVKAPKTESKIPGPLLSRSPSKPNLATKEESLPVKQQGDAQSTPLLHRSPSKAALFPGHASTHHHQASNQQTEKASSPLLSRAPLHGSPVKPKPTTHAGDDVQMAEALQPPLLARSPHKMSVSKPAAQTTSHTSEQQPKPTSSNIPLLARSPTKPPPASPNPSTLPVTPSTKQGLMSRFNLLRRSPMKSILRSPQRLYSDDPAKLAAGTHLATPPKPQPLHHQTQAGSTPPSSATKRVDFTASTKARHAAHPPPSSDSSSKTTTTAAAPAVAYPDLSTLPTQGPPDPASPSPQKRRQTIAPTDFTFRADSQGIVFGAPGTVGTSPYSSSSPDRASRRDTIRAVSAEPDFKASLSAEHAEQADKAMPGSRKRKFAFENSGSSAKSEAADAAVAGEEREEEGGKENVPARGAGAGEEEENDARPSKRTKTSSSSSSSSSAAVRSAGKSAGSAATTASAAAKAKGRAPGMGMGVGAAGRRGTLGVKPRPERHAGSGKSAGGDGKAEPGAGAGTGGVAGQGQGQGKSVISRERLEALSRPKRRG
ncbi:hypothetical protein B0A50_08384 [Salinomyces thailandicus]|uniref:Erythromycin esterase n=1 Tax=Salinomyces thailandicus TaxID=706561 RepID=A0A4U0TM24_9PEZI|nr:hypothetical protein B0A50_08384 [Salinomyces thailandica]